MNAAPQIPSHRARRRLTLAVVGGLAGVALSLAAIYGIGPAARNPTVAAACVPAQATADRIAPLVRGEVAALTVARASNLLPDLAFRDGKGAARTLAEWRGRTVLLNLWATWCLPCREEMPALDSLQAKLGGPAFEVVAVNIDTRNPDRPKTWLKEFGITQLAYYADPTARVFQDLKEIGKAFGMPTTLLIDQAGCEIANLAGPAEWASDDALRVINAALKP